MNDFWVKVIFHDDKALAIRGFTGNTGANDF
jgi:hypothetical protein